MSFVASFRSFHGRHLAKRIKAFLLNEVRKLKIVKESIVATATDNASDVKCATKKDLGLWFSCFFHNLNLTLKDIVYGVAHTKDDDDDDDGEYEDFITDEEALLVLVTHLVTLRAHDVRVVVGVNKVDC